MKRKKGKKQKGAITLNMSGVESGGKIYPEGRYPAVIESAERKEGEESGKEYIEWKFKLTDGKGKGAIVYDNTSLQPQALFRLRGLLEAISFEFPEDDEFEFEPSDVVGEELVLELFEDSYEGRARMKVAAYGEPGSEEGSEEAEEEEEDEDDKPAKGKKKKAGKDKEADAEEEEEVEAPDEDEVNGMDEDELAEVVEKLELDVDLDDAGSLKKQRKAVIAAIEAAAEEGEEEEEEEKPAKKKKGSKDKDEENDSGFSVGDKVTFKDEGTKYKGKVSEIDGDEATVDVKGEEWQVDVSELKAA